MKIVTRRLLAAVMFLAACSQEPVGPSRVASKLEFTIQPRNTTAGLAFNPAVAVTIEDSSGQVVANWMGAVTLTLNRKLGLLSGATTVNAVNGVAIFDDLSIQRSDTGYALAAWAVNLTPAASAPFAVIPAAPAQLVFITQASTASQTRPITPAIQVAIEDAFGNTVTGAASAVTVAIGKNPAGGTLTGTTTVQAANGVATFSDLSIDKPSAGYTLVATAAGLTNAETSPFSIILSLPAGAKLAFTVQPQNATAGVALSPAVVVTIEDSLGHPVAGATNTVKILLNGIVAAGNASVPAVNGVATFANLSFQVAGQMYLTAVCDTLARVNSDTFAIIAAAPAQLVFSTQPSRTWPGQSITPAIGVRVEDAFHNLVTQATNLVTLAIWTNPSGGTLSGTTSVSSVNGIASFADIAIDRSGRGYVLLASAGGLTEVASAPFDVHILWASVSAGAWHSCGISAAGGSYCWGWNHFGQLGNGSQTDQNAPAPVAGGLHFAALSAGGQHTCGLTSAGVAYCWGDNEFGELGSGDTILSSVPVAVAGGLSFVTVSAGDEYHTCALTSGGVAYCWGRNSSGQLGSGDTIRSAVPVAVSGGLTFVTVSPGSQHTCGLTALGAAYCWGNNVSGQLGTGDTISSAVPRLVSGGLTFASLHSGYFHTCGVTSTGAAYCWGQNSGALGDGATTTMSSVPVAVSGSLAFSSLNAGNGFTCGIASAGTYCWGSNPDGRLGTGGNNVNTPTQLAGAVTLAAVNPGAFHTCGVTNIGAAYCWGLDNYGQVGAPQILRRICVAHQFATCVRWVWISFPYTLPTPVSDPLTIANPVGMRGTRSP